MHHIAIVHVWFGLLNERREKLKRYQVVHNRANGALANFLRYLGSLGCGNGARKGITPPI